MKILTKIKQKFWTQKSKKDELTIEEIKKALMEFEKMEEERLKGDGKAVFLSDMSEEEYQEYLHDEVNGWKRFNNKIKNILNI